MEEGQREDKYVNHRIGLLCGFSLAVCSPRAETGKGRGVSEKQGFPSGTLRGVCLAGFSVY